MTRRQAATLTFVGLVAAALLGWPRVGILQTQPIQCPQALHEFIACVKQQLPRAQAANGEPNPPSAAASEALRDAARALYARALSDAADCSIVLPPLIRAHYTVQGLSANGQTFCALWEGRRGVSALGWGTLIVNRKPERRLILGVPHPLFDFDTLAQASRLHADLRTLGLVIAGSHRHALAPMEDCAAWTYARSDATHQHTGYFSLASAFADDPAADAKPWWYLEWHGMQTAEPGQLCYDNAADAPLDAFLSPGAASPAPQNTFASRLAESMAQRQPGWLIKSTTDPVLCDKIGSANLLGRFLNGAPVAQYAPPQCGAPLQQARQISGRFVHIEQVNCAHHDCSDGAPRVRSAPVWRDAIAEVYAELSATVHTADQ